ncbi:hypothetical protein [uncultured Butyricimonas sp.]|uniref:hypothetical protein n=1 Tax=uncultured Butyricimonas sp. TaxID=1268785 RepID=UPI0026DBA5C4|nr:hypothetical protein [uncultured Butyricimonas sp.]
MKLNRLIGAFIFGNIFLLMAMMFSSCQRFDENIKMDDECAKENISLAMSRSVDGIDEQIVYPKGIVPEWVKDSLSKEGYDLVCQLSEKYEMSYYPISTKKKSRNLFTVDEEKNKKVIEWLLNVPLEEECDLEMGVAPRVKSFSSESGGGTWWPGIGGGSTGGGSTGGGSTSDEIKMCSQTHTIYRKKWGMGMMFVDVTAGYKYHSIDKIATEFKTINVTTDRYVLAFNIYWQERSHYGEIVNNGKNLDLHVNGRLKTSIEIEGLVGTDLVIESINETFNFPVEPGHTDDYLKPKK